MKTQVDLQDTRLVHVCAHVHLWAHVCTTYGACGSRREDAEKARLLKWDVSSKSALALETRNQGN